MENNKYVNSNLIKLCINLQNVFKFNFDESIYILKTIVNSLKYEEFYQNKLDNSNIDNLLSIDKLANLKQYLLSLDNDEDLIRKIILSTPQILLFSNSINNIYHIYKANNYKGCALLNNKTYKAYVYKDVDIKYNNENNNYEYMINIMLSQLNREDVVRKLGIKDNIDIEDKFGYLVRKYSKKNYYFKK